MEGENTGGSKLHTADEDHHTAAGGDSGSEKNCRNNENHAENLENIDMRNKLNVSASYGDLDNNLGLRTPVRFRGDGIRK